MADGWLCSKGWLLLLFPLNVLAVMLFGGGYDGSIACNYSASCNYTLCLPYLSIAIFTSSFRSAITKPSMRFFQTPLLLMRLSIKRMR